MAIKEKEGQIFTSVCAGCNDKVERPNENLPAAWVEFIFMGKMTKIQRREEGQQPEQREVEAITRIPARYCEDCAPGIDSDIFRVPGGTMQILETRSERGGILGRSGRQPR